MAVSSARNDVAAPMLSHPVPPQPALALRPGVACAMPLPHQLWPLRPPPPPQRQSYMPPQPQLHLQTQRSLTLCPQDATTLIVDFAVGTLLELLSIALVSRQFHFVSQQRFLNELRWCGCSGQAKLDKAFFETTGDGRRSSRRHRAGGLGHLLAPQVAQQFVTLPDLQISSPGVLAQAGAEEPVSAAFASFSEDQDLLHCQDCSMPILKADDVISSNYRIMTGRAYLTLTAYNITVSDDMHEAHYTTGRYMVRNVSCSGCALRLGITYVRALDSQNGYKVGKFLVGQNFFVRPSCCLMRSRRMPVKLPTPLCPRCRRTAARGSLQLVDIMTSGLSVQKTRQLYELLVRQQVLEAFAEPRVASARQRLLAAPRMLMSWCLPLLCSHHGAKASAVEKLRQLTAAGVEPVDAMEQLRADLWQETLRERMSMLCSLRPFFQGEHLSAMLCATIRFVSALCRVAGSVAPCGASRPERVTMILELLPALVPAGHADALHCSRALALALRREWIVGAGGFGARPPALTSKEIEAIAGAIAAHASVGIASQTNAPGRVKRLVVSLSTQLNRDASARLGEEDTTAAPLLPPPGVFDPPEAAIQDDPLEEVEVFEDQMSDSTTVVEDELLLQCLSCATPVLKADDVLSSNYRIMTGPAYLAAAAYNVQLSMEDQEADYTSGRYTVRDVFCAQCGARLGVMYVHAADVANEYKVGKFLLCQDQLLLSPEDALWPTDEESLRAQLLELLHRGSTVSVPPADMRQRRSMEGAREPLIAVPVEVATVAGQLQQHQQHQQHRHAHQPTPATRGYYIGGRDGVRQQPRQRFIVTIKRYIRCILPAARYVPQVLAPQRQGL